MDNKVYIVKCPDYEQAREKLAELMAMMNGMDSFAKPGEKIVLKTNLLLPAKPEQGVTTHPAVVAAIGQMAKDAGAIPIIADSPGSGFKYNQKTMERIYRRCGMYKAAEDAGIEVNLDTTYDTVSFPKGKLIKRFEVITPILHSDGVFNLCKLKTHLFMHMTGAVKNNFGVIPGLTKPGYHAKLHDKNLFANMLLDLAEYVSPRLSVMDAVLGLEGEGPGTAGEPRHVGLLIASTSSLALDVVASEIIGLDRETNPVLAEAEKRDMHPTRIEDVQVEGCDISELRIADYKFPGTVTGKLGNMSVPLWQKPLEPLFEYSKKAFGESDMMPWFHKAMSPLFRNAMALKPRVVKKNCIACGVCRDSCPMHVITIIDEKYAQINEDECIRCYCCHEMCQHDAVGLHKSLLYRVLNR